MEPDPAPNNIMVLFILIVISTLIIAFFTAAEMAIMSINKNKIKELAQEGNKKAMLLTLVISEPMKYLVAIRTLITFAGVGFITLAATSLSGSFTLYLENLNVIYSRQIALASVIILLSYTTLVFGELFPKRIARQKPEAVAMSCIVPIMLITKLVTPFATLLNVSTNILVKITGLGKENLEEELSKEEMKSFVEIGQQRGAINETERIMINNIIEFDDKSAIEVMTPRTEVFFIDINEPTSEFLDELLEEKYSRMPVYEDDIDNIIGILHMKDFIVEARTSGFENVDIKKILHPPYLVSESKNIDELFKELQKTKNHMAVLIDEYGGFSGLVTVKDIIEEVMGDIEDEYDDDEPDIRKVDNNTYIVNGLLSIGELNDHLDLNLVSEQYNTIGGFLISLLGCIPKINENKTIQYGNVIFKIEEVKERRIGKIKICI
ncbi:MAG: hemolysin family protein [Clostridium sp.]|uniref:hemolysin family protein n=1 Tax=Clostridium sp. TaxID=1506 RepID=UPI003D6C81FC